MIGLDTSFLLAAEGRHQGAHWRTASDIINRLDASDLVVPAQALAEMLLVLQTVMAVPADEAGTIVLRWLAATRTVDLRPDIVAGARQIASATSLPMEDALMLAGARAGGARYLLSEDFADGLVAGGVTTINPFTPEGRRRIETVIGDV